MIKEITAVELYCDECKEPFKDEFGTAAFHRTADDIRAAASNMVLYECYDNWRVNNPDTEIPGKDICNVCREKQEAQEEHQ